MKKTNDIDWQKVIVGDKLPKIHEPSFPAGGKVEKIEWGISLYEGAIGDFWVQYPKGVYRFTIISGKINSLSKVEEVPTDRSGDGTCILDIL